MDVIENMNIASDKRSLELAFSIESAAISIITHIENIVCPYDYAKNISSFSQKQFISM